MLMLIACVTMLVDHIGFAFFKSFDEVIALRIIGRLAMPIYAYFIAKGFEYTRNREKYFKRIALIALIAQIPYIIIGNDGLDICFTWLFSLIFLQGLEERSSKRYLYLGASVAAVFILPFYCSFDYGVYGFLFPVIFYYRNKNKENKGNLYLMISMIIILIIKLLNAIYFNEEVKWATLQFFALLSIPIIIFCEKKNIDRTNNKKLKLCYRWFYPGHLLILAIIRIALGRVTW